MKKRRLSAAILCIGMTLASTSAMAQINYEAVFSQLKLEARADFDYYGLTSDNSSVWTHDYGMRGRYFNMLIGGNINEQFSYFFRQRIIAKPGTVNLFDNTDFLYINYNPTKNWIFRFGKDALAVGGIEYDASPIDVLFSTVYWDNFYCFQPAFSIGKRNDDGSQLFLAQVSNSPYVHYGAALGTGLGEEWKIGLFSYNLYYAGQFGHLKLKHSVNMMQRADRNFMNYIALGHEVDFQHWDLYVDLIHHANAWNDWGHNFAIIACGNIKLDNGLSFFLKGAYEQNKSNEVLTGFGNSSTGFYDCFVEAGHAHFTYGGGAEYSPTFCPDFKLHFFVADRTDQVDNQPISHRLEANLGVTWYMDIHRMFKKNGKTSL